MTERSHKGGCDKTKHMAPPLTPVVSISRMAHVTRVKIFRLAIHALLVTAAHMRASAFRAYRIGLLSRYSFRIIYRIAGRFDRLALRLLRHCRHTQ